MNASKNLYPNGEIKNSIRITNALIVDIPKKIDILKSFHLQYNMLGYIVNGTEVIKSKSPIFSMVNRQINRSDQRYIKDERYRNARTTVLRFFKKPEELKRNTSIYYHFLEAMSKDVHFIDSKDNVNNHVVIINRLFRKNKGEALFLHIENLEDQ